MQALESVEAKAWDDMSLHEFTLRVVYGCMLTLGPIDLDTFLSHMF